MARKNIQLNQVERAEAAGQAAVAAPLVQAMPWAELRELAKQNGISIYHKTRAEIEAELLGA